MNASRSWRGWGLLLLAHLGLGLRAEISFSREIAPILQQRCVTCHQSGKAKGRYRLDTWSVLAQPGATGRRPLAPGQPQESELFQRLEATDPDERMPQEADPLPVAERQRLRQWIEEGARFDGANPELPLAALSRPGYPKAPEAYPRPLPVTALAFSPDGTELAVSGYHELTVWSVAGRRLVRRLGGLAERTSVLAWHPSQPWIVAAGGAPGLVGEAVVVEAATGTLVRVLVSTADIPPALALSPNGERVAVGGTDGAIHVVNVETGRRELFLPHHADWILALAWSPDGTRLVSASRDRTARVVDASQGEAIASFTGHGAAVTAAWFAPDGRSVWTAGRDRHLRRWDAANSDQKQDLAGLEDEVTALLGLGNDGWEANAAGLVRRRPGDRPGNPVAYPVGPRVLSLAIHAATQQVAAGTQDGQVLVWDLRKGETPEPARFLAAPGLESSARTQPRP